MKKFEIHPKRPVAGILPNQRRIDKVMQLPLSRKEFLRCMNNATLYAVVGEDKVLVTDLDYDKALKLFDTHVEYVNKTINLAEDFNQDEKIDWKTKIPPKESSEVKFEKLDKPVEIPPTGIVVDREIKKALEEADKVEDSDDVPNTYTEDETEKPEGQEKTPNVESTKSNNNRSNRRRR